MHCGAWDEPDCDAGSCDAAAATSSPLVAQAALFYTKAGSLYVSDPAGTPGRKLTDGPADTEPAPSPDLVTRGIHPQGERLGLGRRAVDPRSLAGARIRAGKPRRLVDPAALPTFGGAPTLVTHPRWSPSGGRIAFLESGEGGGFLHVAAADSGEVVSAEQRLFADDGYAWAPDGRHIAWTGGRSDVSPVDVNILAVGATSTPVVQRHRRVLRDVRPVSARRSCSPTVTRRWSPTSRSHSATAASTPSRRPGEHPRIRRLHRLGLRRTAILRRHRGAGFRRDRVHRMGCGRIVEEIQVLDARSPSIAHEDRRCGSRRTLRRHGERVTSSPT